MALDLGGAPRDRNIKVEEHSDSVEQKHNLLDVARIKAEELEASMLSGKLERGRKLRR